MQATTYGIRVDVALPWDAAIARTIDALKTEGFGVLTTIDVQATLRSKLDREFRKYVILGACNPVLADRALHAELEVGLLLPCNVIVYEIGPSHVVVAAMAPLVALGIVGDNPALHVRRPRELQDVRVSRGPRPFWLAQLLLFGVASITCFEPLSFRSY